MDIAEVQHLEPIRSHSGRTRTSPLDPFARVCRLGLGEPTSKDSIERMRGRQGTQSVDEMVTIELSIEPGDVRDLKNLREKRSVVDSGVCDVARRLKKSKAKIKFKFNRFLFSSSQPT